MTEPLHTHTVTPSMSWQGVQGECPWCRASFPSAAVLTTTEAGDLIREIELEAVNSEIDRRLAARIITALRALPTAREWKPIDSAPKDDAADFDRANWFWRTMDPDDNGDSPEEAINRAMLGHFCVCEIASSYTGPTRYGFVAPTLNPDDDETEFVHFATHQEAMAAAKARVTWQTDHVFRRTCCQMAMCRSHSAAVGPRGT